MTHRKHLPADVRMEADGAEMDMKAKCEALIKFGHVHEMEAAVYFLIDCGEYDPGDESLDGLIDIDELSP